MKPTKYSISMLLSEELPGDKLANLTGGRGNTNISWPPHDLVTPDGDEPNEPYTCDDIDSLCD